MLTFDVRNFSEDRRKALAWKVHELPDFALPRLGSWNYDPCRQHRTWDQVTYDDNGEVASVEKITHTPKPGCRRCAILFRQHQRVGIAWLYLAKNALLADTMGPQPLSAPVLTPSGWVRMGDLRVGDAVVDPRGQDSVVEEIRPQGVRTVYRVTFSDGASTEAAGDHLWEVQTPDRKYHGRPAQVRTTEALLASGLTHANGNRKWYIPLTGPVDFSHPEEKILDSYLVGVLLGDGSLTSRTVLSTDFEIVQNLELPKGVTWKKAADKNVDYSADFRFSGLSPYVRALGLNVRSEAKKVPEEYLWASADDRLALLQGLLDTDGTPSDTGVEFGTTSPDLASAVGFLTQSLGGTFSMRETDPHYVLPGGTRIAGQHFYRMYLRLPSTITPFRLSRKAERLTARTKYEPVRSIVSIEPVRVDEVQCIVVSADSHLYVTEDFIVTHNSGKTTHAGGLIAMLLETGEIPSVGRAIVVPRAPALNQWRDELLRMMPGLNVVVAGGTRKQRTQTYLHPWDVLLIGPEMLRNDYEMLLRFPLSLFVSDDIDQLRNPENKTSYVMDRMGRRADRYVIMSGTPLQKRLPELHAVLDGIGGTEALGSLDYFEKRYVRREFITDFDPKEGKEYRRQQIVGYKNLGELKRNMAPLVLRRTQFGDVSMPTIVPDDVMLDLYPAQKAKYAELKQGVIRIMREEGEQVKHTTAMSKLHYGSAICAGLAALGEPDAPRTSVKLDWIIEQLTRGALEDEKVVIFANLKNTVRALQNRLHAEGIGFVTVWGENKSKEDRHAAQTRFWDDPNCRVLIGTKAIEQSLNLQVARHLINVDMILNPARMEQLAGRIRRDGSAYSHVFVHNLLTVNTQEERYLPLLEREAALAAHIWDENSQLFSALSATALLQLISG